MQLLIFCTMFACLYTHLTCLTASYLVQALSMILSLTSHLHPSPHSYKHCKSSS